MNMHTPYRMLVYMHSSRRSEFVKKVGLAGVLGGIRLYHPINPENETPRCTTPPRQSNGGAQMDEP